MNVHFDYMHTKYLGVDAVAFGSIFHLLCHYVLPHDDPKKNLNLRWQHISAAYKKYSITERYRGMRKLTLFDRKKGGPKLKGRAGQIAVLGQPLLCLWEHFMNSELEVHCKVQTFLKVNIAMERLMKEMQSELAFPEPQASQFKEFSFALCQLHLQLGSHFKEEGNALFASTPKMHMLLHSCLTCAQVNPRLTWCFRGEDLQKNQQELGW